MCLSPNSISRRLHRFELALSYHDPIAIHSFEFSHCNELINKNQPNNDSNLSVHGCLYISGPFVGWLLDRFTIRQVTLCGAFVATLGFVISTFAQSVEVLIITYGVIGGELITQMTVVNYKKNCSI